jgi:hypothetical protein
MLHITNGDIVAEKLREAGVPGEVVISADVLHEGPCPTADDEAVFRETRARYLASAGYTDYDEALAALVAADAALDVARDDDEIVLWFEHDLFDQLQLLRVLAASARRGPARATLSLICIGAYPGVPRFHGLGQLSAGQLLRLFPERAVVTRQQLDTANDAWRRFGANDPRPFAALLREDTSALPYLAGAVRRQLEELPSTLNGLSRTEHQALAAVAAGAADLAAAFRSTQEMEDRVFMGDLSFARAVRTLASAGLPPLLLAHSGGADVPLARPGGDADTIRPGRAGGPRRPRHGERRRSLGRRCPPPGSGRRVALGCGEWVCSCEDVEFRAVTTCRRIRASTREPERTPTCHS